MRSATGKVKESTGRQNKHTRVQQHRADGVAVLLDVGQEPVLT
ncbi:hypothetical protein [Streptomyces sp. NPDC002215]